KKERKKVSGKEKGVRTLYQRRTLFQRLLPWYNICMGRPLRSSLGGFVFHVLNRGNGREPVFLKDGDYDAFLRVMREAQEHVPGMRLLAYCLMPNHWHLILWPQKDGELSDYMHWLTLTHTQRWHAHYRNVGVGHLYQ